MTHALPLDPGTIIKTTASSPAPEGWRTPVPAGERYEIVESQDGELIAAPMEYHCNDCASDFTLPVASLPDYVITAVPVVPVALQGVTS